MLGVFVVIFGASGMVFCLDWSRQFQHQSALQEQSREDWLTQESRSPHQATHHGTTVYKLPSPLAGFDPGVSNEVGTAVKIESHKRYEATDLRSEDQISLLNLDFTTPALMMQAVFPLIVIVLSHATVSREREQGTWRLLASLGVSSRRIILGKLSALLILMAILTVPMAMTLLWNIVRVRPDAEFSTTEVLARAATISLMNVFYLTGWCAFGTGVSARFSSGTTLVILLSLWAVWTLIVPRLAVDLAYSRFPLPSEQSLLQQRETSIRQGTDGNVSLKDFNAKLEEQLLREFQVTDLEDLPINLDAARLLAMEEFTDAIDDNTQEQLKEIYRQQNRFVDRFEVVSLYLAVRSVSSAFAATDQHHHASFVDSTEKYRRLLVKTMNTAEMKGETPGPTAESARAFWARVPEFRMHPPPVTTVLKAMRQPIFLLLGWFVLTFAFAVVSVKGTVS